MALWHCNRCRREFEAPEGSVAFFHHCLDETGRRREPAKLEALPPDQAGRDDLWHGLLSLVAAARPFIEE